MLEHIPARHPWAAALSLLAAGLGSLAVWLEPAIEGGHGLYATFTPDDLTAWVKAISNAIFIVFNTMVGCYNLFSLLGRPRRKRKRKGDRPADVAGDIAPPSQGSP